MKIKVLRGTIKYNDMVYLAGQIFEIADSQAKSIILEGIAEEFIEDSEVPVEEPRSVEENTESADKSSIEATTEEEGVSSEPSIDWTRKELEEYALGVGIESPEKFPTKSELLEAITKSQGVKE